MTHVEVDPNSSLEDIYARWDDYLPKDPRYREFLDMLLTTAPTDGTTTHHSHCGKGCSVASTEDTEDDGEEDDTTTTLRPAWQQHKEDSGPGRNGPPSASP